MKPMQTTLPSIYAKYVQLLSLPLGVLSNKVEIFTVAIISFYVVCRKAIERISTCMKDFHALSL